MLGAIAGMAQPIRFLQARSVICGVDRILDARLPKPAKIKTYDRKVLLIWSEFALADQLVNHFAILQPGIESHRI